MPTIALDEPETWPDSVKRVLDRVLQDQQCQLPSDRSGSPFLVERYVAEVEQLIDGYFVVAYHCTRLTQDEIRSVKFQGLRTLDEECVRKRVAARVEGHELSYNQAECLLSRCRRRVNSYPGCGGHLWAVLSRDALTDEHGLGSPFRYWGGEIMLDFSDDVCSTLANIGTACIVEFSAPVSRSRLTSIGKGLLERFLWLNQLGNEDGPIDLALDTSIPPEHVRRVVQRTDTEFELLTGCSEWSFVVT